VSRIYDALRRAEAARGKEAGSVRHQPAEASVVYRPEFRSTTAFPHAALDDPAAGPQRKESQRSRRRPVQAPRRGSETESYEELVRCLSQLASAGEGRVLLLVGSVPGEGVSHVARNLAATLIERGQRAILVDANLRSPSQHEAFGVEQGPGLSSLDRGIVSLDRALRFSSDFSLGLLTSGSACSRPSKFFREPIFEDTLSKLRYQSDWVILDGAPVTIYPESSELARLADGVVLVVRANRTKWDVARKAQELLHKVEANLLGAVLNRHRRLLPRWLDR